MDGRVYFVSDVHLGLRAGDPDEREARFVRFLRELPREGTAALCMLGDIWDFWYEYRDVVPRLGARVVAALISLMDDGVEVWFCPGNHDVWTFSHFESLGMRRLTQPEFVRIGGADFCLGHGDALGRTTFGQRLITSIFHSKVCQALFSILHPWIAYRFGLGWSKSNRGKHVEYHFKGEEEPLYSYALGVSESRHVDFFVFGHFHDPVDMKLPTGARLVVLDDWMDGGTPHAVFEDGKLISF